MEAWRPAITREMSIRRYLGVSAVLHARQMEKATARKTNQSIRASLVAFVFYLVSLFSDFPGICS